MASSLVVLIERSRSRESALVRALEHGTIGWFFDMSTRPEQDERAVYEQALRTLTAMRVEAAETCPFGYEA